MIRALRTALFTAFCVIFLTPHAVAFDTASAWRSATIARDINGFALGTHIEEIGRAVRLEALGGGDYDGWHNGIEYDFGVSPLGRVYRIGIRQDLGNFLIDAAFLQTLENRLFSKYGTSNDYGRNPWFWELVERVKDADGNEFAQETNWMTAHVSRSSDGTELSIKMLDFRILWEDIDALNQSPRDDALDAAQF